MKDHIQYAKYVFRHKWYVLRASRTVGAGLWRCLVHDLSKFLPSEWGPYVHAFYDRSGRGRYEPTAAVDMAWLKHQRRNLHHWQAWVLREDDGDTIPIRMPLEYVREMLADWIGAGMALGKGEYDVVDWYWANEGKMILHRETRAVVESYISWLSFARRDPVLYGGCPRFNYKGFDQ